MKKNRADIPKIEPDQFRRCVREVIPAAAIDFSVVNPDYHSWCLRVREGRLDVEFVWGPQSGFGGRDIARPATGNDTPFDYADELFWSQDEALHYLKTKRAFYS